MANFCANCGTEIPVGEGFCPKCGQMVDIGMGNASLQVQQQRGFQPQMPNQQMNTGHTVNGPVKKQSAIGITAGALGIAGALLFAVPGIGLLLGIAALILGIVGLSKKNEYKTGMALTGVITGSIAVVLGLIMLMVMMYTVGSDAGWDDGYDSGYGSGYDSGYEIPWYEKIFE